MSKKLLFFLFACMIALPALADTSPAPDTPSSLVAPASATTVTDIVINEILYDPKGTIEGDANGDGMRSGDDDEFVEIINQGSSPVDISNWTLSDAAAVRHTFPSGTVLAAGCGIVVFGGGTPTGDFGDMLVQTTSTLSLTNDGDTVTLNDGTSDVDSHTYPAGNINQSLTRDPDGTGSFVNHSTATGSGGALFSPGTQIDGTSFAGCSAPAPVLDADLFINEIDYRGSDPGDTFLELIVGPNDETLSMYHVVLYRADGTVALFPDDVTPIILPVSAFSAGVTVGDFDFYVFFGSVDVASNLFSNPGDALALCKDAVGSDGIPDALVSNGEDNPTLQFLSQQGTTLATEGCAKGHTSIDLGVSQPPGAPDGTSIGLSGDSITPEPGSEFADFTPASFDTPNPPASTPGEPNLYQVLENNNVQVCPAPFRINDFSPRGEDFVETEDAGNVDLTGLYLINYDGSSGEILSSYAYAGTSGGDGLFSIGKAGANPDQVVAGFDLQKRRAGIAVVTRKPVPGENISNYEFPEETCAIVLYQKKGVIVNSYETPAPGAKRDVTLFDWEMMLLSDEEVPADYVLSQNYPNPFNPRTQISFHLPEASEVSLSVYDMLGREVTLLAQGFHEAGLHEVTFDGNSLPSGVYLYRLQTETFTETHRMLLLK